MAHVVASYPKVQSNCRRREIAPNKHLSRHDMADSARCYG